MGRIRLNSFFLNQLYLGQSLGLPFAVVLTLALSLLLLLASRGSFVFLH